MRRWRGIGRGLAGAVALGLVLVVVGTPRSGRMGTVAAGEVVVEPDLAGVELPPNLAPLSFRFRASASAYGVRVQGSHGAPLAVTSRRSSLRLPARQWRALLVANRGGELSVTTAVQDHSGRWQGLTRRCRVGAEPIDRYVVYRLLRPLHNTWGSVGIYQRDLSGFTERVILHGRQYENGCVNCHAFRANHTDRLTIQVRSKIYDSATLLVDHGVATKLADKFGYTAWHPSGKLVTYSANEVRQWFHHGGPETREVMDVESKLMWLDVATLKSQPIPGASSPQRLETYPAWSPDGRTLYYCSSPQIFPDPNRVPPPNHDQARYELRRISYDPDRGTWGPVATVLTAQQVNGSISFPRVSPDGRWLMFTLAHHGCFPIHHVEADLALVDLQTGAWRKLDELNSPTADTWHTWSSRGGWFVFASKRGDGVHGRLFLSRLDAAGRASTPLLLPQRDPAANDRFPASYNVPELTIELVPTNAGALGRLTREPLPADAAAQHQPEGAPSQMK